MGLRKGDFFLGYAAVLVLCGAAALTHARLAQKAAEPAVREKKELVRSLELTDLCLFTEATYTRHPSQATLHVPFQEQPASFDHFPSGSLFPPPATVRKTHGPMG